MQNFLQIYSINQDVFGAGFTYSMTTKGKLTFEE